MCLNLKCDLAVALVAVTTNAASKLANDPHLKVRNDFGQTGIQAAVVWVKFVRKLVEHIFETRVILC